MALFNNGYTKKTSIIPIFRFPELSVVFFFVLSGFLITYLLLNEKEKREISVRAFYIKRVLRIWPLYFLIIAASFIYFNQSPFFHWHGLTDIVTISNHPVLSAFLLLLISPNVLLLFTPALGYASPTWSIGVEEQFYLMWPWIMKSKKPLFFIISIILIVHLLSNGILSTISYPFSSTSIMYKILTTISTFFTFPYSFKIDAMAIGALGAFAVKSRSAILPVVFSKSFQFILYALFVLMFASASSASYQFYSVIFILIILNMAINVKSIVNIQNKVLDYLGKISYGIYMFHALTIIPSIYLVVKILRLEISLISELLICFVSLSSTIIVASISYYFYESYFLRLKDKHL